MAAMDLRGADSDSEETTEAFMESVGVNRQLADNYRDYYKDGASEWRRLGSLGKVDNIVTLCRHLAPTSVIEIGAGEGSNLRRLAEVDFCKSLWAVDISPTGVNAVVNKSIPTLVECRLFDGYHVPYADKQFDLAILSHVLEHVEHPRLLIYEAARVAKFVFVEVPLEDTIRLPQDFTFDVVGHIDAYSPRSIRRLLQSCGLSIERQVTTNPAKGTYTYLRGRPGLVNYYTKLLLLRLWPSLATRIFTYHGALLCASGGQPACGPLEPDRDAAADGTHQFRA
jgi:hypothetical protein